MKIYSVLDKEFAEYGKIIKGDFADLVEILKDKPCPENTMYVPHDADFEKTASWKNLNEVYYGGLPVQVGYCNGHNNKLNCLEYHRDSEFNLSNDEFILLVARRGEIVDGKLDTSKVVAFKAPANTMVEVFATTLHYAPCGVDGKGFRVLVVLPRGTNVAPLTSPLEPSLWMTNKWLLAHPDTNEAKKGAYVGLVGENLSI